MNQPQVRTRTVEGPAAGTGESVRVEVITLARSEKKNAMTPAMLQDVLAALKKAGEDGRTRARAVVLEGEGAALSAGFDLTLCKDDPAALGELLTGLSRVVSAMRNLLVPVVVACHGAAIAGGAAILAGADFVITHTDAKIGYPAVKLGISPAVSGPTLESVVGGGAARRLLLDHSLISGWEAYQMGLAAECLEDAGKVRDRALAVALALAGKPTGGMRATKKLLNELEGDGVRQEMGLAASLTLVGGTEERERLAAVWK